MPSNVGAGAAKLNVMQRIMLQWSELHPYNASHIYKIAGPGDLDRLRAAIGETFVFNRLGAVELAGDGVHYRVAPLAAQEAPEIQVIEDQDDVERGLTAHVAEALNRPFPRPRCCPMRFALISGDSGAHYVVSTYDHWTADSVASRLVLRHVLGRYLDLRIPDNQRPLAFFPGTYRDAFRGRLSSKRMAVAASTAARRFLFESPAAQPAYLSVQDMAVGYQLRHTAPGAVSRVRQYARSLGATVHDVILAALARAMAHHLPRRSSRGRRRDLALSTVVDTRRDAVDSVRESLGAFLAYHVVHLSPQGVGSLEEAVRRVAALTAAVKAGRGYLDCLASMKLIAAIWPRLTESVRPRFMRKAFSLTAGVSNVVVRDDWLGVQGGDRILDYSRSVHGPHGSAGSISHHDRRGDEHRRQLPDYGFYPR